MLKLHALENTELSSYCLKILEKHGITLVREFNSEKDAKLGKIMNLNCEQVKKLKEEFRRLYGPKRYTGVDLYMETNRNKKTYGTYIDSLDQMLTSRDLLSNLSFWEICGPTGVGKTQLVLSLMLNFVINQVAPALYIDTKLDFSASRIKNMLEARGIQQKLYAGIMSFIKVERVLSAQGVVEMLEEFLKQLKKGNENVNSIKMIVIDSLPAAWFLLPADCHRLSGKWLLSRLNQIINRLVQQHYISVICVNLSLVPQQEENWKTSDALFSCNDNDICDLIEDDDIEPDCEKLFYRPVLGNFWLSKPYLRLSLEFPDKNDIGYKENSSLRIIEVLSTRYFRSGLSCSVKLRPEGFV